MQLDHFTCLFHFLTAYILCCRPLCWGKYFRYLLQLIQQERQSWMLQIRCKRKLFTLLFLLYLQYVWALDQASTLELIFSGLDLGKYLLGDRWITWKSNTPSPSQHAVVTTGAVTCITHTGGAIWRWQVSFMLSRDIILSFTTRGVTSN